MLKLKAGHTVAACFAGYITQAIINNFAPLLFVTFHSTYGLSLALIGAMITINFGIQLLVDLFASKFADKIGYRPLIVAAHILAGAGLVFLAVLPEVLPSPAAGLFIAAAVYGIGGGLIEVLVSPIVEACPYRNKKSMMSLLHSFYCWGQLGVVALSTLVLAAVGIGNWRILACVWAVFPLLNAVLFMFVPIYKLVEGGDSMKLSELFRSKTFWLFAFLMICSGSSETAVSQWASAFAETGLGVSKMWGDLLGPCLFAAFMGISRVIFSRYGERIALQKALMAGAVGCVIGYCMCAFVPLAGVGLAGCAVVGFSAGVMWPGVFSFASGKLPKGGTAMFALLALAGDVGCSAGPSAVGAVGDAFGGSLRAGIAFGLLFPALMFIVLLLYGISRRKENRRALAAYMHPDGSAVQSDGSLSADSGELRETDEHALSEDPNERSVASHAGKEEKDQGHSDRLP